MSSSGCIDTAQWVNRDVLHTPKVASRLQWCIPVFLIGKINERKEEKEKSQEKHVKDLKESLQLQYTRVMFVETCFKLFYFKHTYSSSRSTVSFFTHRPIDDFAESREKNELFKFRHFEISSLTILWQARLSIIALGRSNLRSTASHRLRVPRCRLAAFGDRAFQAAGAIV